MLDVACRSGDFAAAEKYLMELVNGGFVVPAESVRAVMEAFVRGHRGSDAVRVLDALEQAKSAAVSDIRVLNEAMAACVASKDVRFFCYL